MVVGCGVGAVARGRVRDDAKGDQYPGDSTVAETLRQVGVLDLQGGVQEHLEHLRLAGVSGKRVKEPADLEALAGLIMPGGESTCLARLLGIFGFEDPLRRAFARGMKIWGTCAGAILLAKTNVGDVSHLGLIDIDVKRNAFGSQLDSFKCEALVPAVHPEPLPLTFIRAPQILRVGRGVNVLLRLDDYIAAAESDEVLVTIFHPELTPGVAFHRYFAHKCGVLTEDDAAPATVSDWNQKSWMRFAPIA